MPNPPNPPDVPNPLHDQLAEGGEMQQEPRGGWRFTDPSEQAAHGAAAPPPPLSQPRRPDPFDVTTRQDEARAALPGDAQNPSHGHRGGGTWVTWAGEVPDAPAHD
jgi:hypothetical protein